MSAIPKTERPFVSVIVPHYQDLEGLRLCLESLAAQTYPLAYVEIVVADNNSPAGEAAVADVVAGRAKLTIVKEKGAGPARNGTVAMSSGEVLVFIDSDCIAEPEWLEEGIEALSRFGLVGGHVRVLVTDPIDMTGVEAFERVFAFDFKTYIEKKGFTRAGNMFCQRALFDRVGPFGVALSEDVDWFHRAVATGATLGYAPKSVVGHPARVTWEQLRSKWRRLNIETYGLTDDRPFRRLQWLARNALVPLSAFVHALKVLASPELTSHRQRALATGVLFCRRFWRLWNTFRMLRSPVARPGD